MSNVVEFKPREDDGDGLLYCPECGSGWFLVQCVNPRLDHTINAYMGPLTCRECAHVVVFGTWVPPDLTTVDDEKGPA